MKICLVTGGSRGIGASTVKKFACEGYSVILNYNKSAAEAKALCADLNAKGCDVRLFRADVADCEQASAMFRYVESTFKRLDVLVNNAGVALYGQCQDVSEADFDRVMSVNAKGAFFCSAAAVKLFLSRGRGSIVNVSSIWGLRGASCESVYSMSKHALVGLTKSLSDELEFSDIAVNCVCPPIVTTQMCGELSPEDIEEFCRTNGKRVFTPEQVAEDIFRLATCGNSGIVLEE